MQPLFEVKLTEDEIVAIVKTIRPLAGDGNATEPNIYRELCEMLQTVLGRTV